ncbi:MAG: hypothetical protein P8X96_03365 [Desulfobacteraceae bacterium]
MIPIDTTERAITHLARSFVHASRYNLEVFGYWVGLKNDRLTHLILPEFLMGITRDHRGAMAYATNTRCRSLVMFAIQADCGDMGVMVNACPGVGGGLFAEGNWIFIPFELLVLNRPMAAYLTDDARSNHFPSQPTDQIYPMDIAETIRSSPWKKQTHLLDDRDEWTTYDYLPSLDVRIDAFVSSGSIYPMNPFILKALGMNRFANRRNGTDEFCYGRVHVHYAYRLREILGDALIKALHKMDRRFYELMTPVDAVSMLDSARAVRDISKQRMAMTQQIEAIVALDPKSLKVVGRSFFDLKALESPAERNSFRDRAEKALHSRDIEAHINWFAYIRGLSTQAPPS